MEGIEDVLVWFLPVGLPEWAFDAGPPPPFVGPQDSSPMLNDTVTYQGEVISITGTSPDGIYEGSPSPYDKPETPPSPPAATESSPFSLGGIPGFPSMLLPLAFKPTSLILPAFSPRQAQGMVSISTSSDTFGAHTAEVWGANLYAELTLDFLIPYIPKHIIEQAKREAIGPFPDFSD